MKKKDNYLDKIPKKNEKFNWISDDNGIVTLEIQNEGFFNRVFQKLLKKPPVTYIHLDKTGSFIWSLIDGKTDVYTLGKAVEDSFGEDAKPLYERLVKFFHILESYNFIVW